MTKPSIKTLFQKHSRKPITIIIAVLFSISLWQLATASWIQGKAIIARQLLNHSWRKTLSNKNFVQQQPWPWADSWPVAKLFVPQHNIEQIILAGDSGNNLAFAQGYSLVSSLPNSHGTTMISAHRDTHFNFLKNININETLYLKTANKTIPYRVYDLQIVDSKTYTLQTETNSKTLVLVTCYPFDAISAGGTLRYLVFAAQKTEANII